MESEWPADGLEALGQCPVCGSPDREVMYSGLRDIVFGVAPGKWTLHRCHGCECAYLDPRPTRETIGLAYQNYFTHGGDGREPDHKLTLGQHWARKLANGYRNRHFGTQESSAHWLGVVAGLMSAGFRKRINRSFRCLQSHDRGRRVLDVGCGGGNFMYWARAMGCEVLGTDPDPVAVANAQALGFDVREGGIEAFGDEHQSFDIITLGHVIEHVHDPVDTLRKAHRLLRPGGALWLETPNLDSLGRQIYGRYWRGIESPRHLVLFTFESLENAIHAAGFTQVRLRPVAGVSILKKSAALARNDGYVPEKSVRPRLRSQKQMFEAFQILARKGSG